MIQHPTDLREEIDRLRGLLKDAKRDNAHDLIVWNLEKRVARCENQLYDLTNWNEEGNHDGD